MNLTNKPECGEVSGATQQPEGCCVRVVCNAIKSVRTQDLAGFCVAPVWIASGGVR